MRSTSSVWMLGTRGVIWSLWGLSTIEPSETFPGFAKGGWAVPAVLVAAAVCWSRPSGGGRTDHEGCHFWGNGGRLHQFSSSNSLEPESIGAVGLHSLHQFSFASLILKSWFKGFFMFVSLLHRKSWLFRCLLCLLSPLTSISHQLWEAWPADVDDVDARLRRLFEGCANELLPANGSPQCREAHLCIGQSDGRGTFLG